MAKLNEQTITIKISELLKDNEPANDVLDADVLEQLIAVVQELAGDKRLVEITSE